MTSRGTRYWSSGSIPLIAPDVLGGIIASAADLALVITDAGEILSVIVNPGRSGFGNLEGWQGKDIRSTLTAESVPKLESHLERYLSGDTTPRAIELNHDGVDLLQFPIAYSLHAIGPDGAILMLGRDLRPIAEMQQQLVRAQMALERDYEARREYETLFRVLLDAGNEATLFVNQSTGRITDLNTAAAALLGGSTDDLTGAAFADIVDTRRKDGEVVDALFARARAEDRAALDVWATETKRALLIRATAFRAAGERMLVCQLRDGADGQEQRSDTLDEHLAGLYRSGTDAIVFTGPDGTVLSANEAFLNLVDVADLASIRKTSLSDYLSRGEVDLRVLLDNARRAGQMRMYATRMASEFGSQTPVEISATWLNDRSDPVAAFVIRDTSRADAVRRPGMSSGDDSGKSVMELVGSATLKEIVADTTDVIERMCIETAIELTNNNRVAAAEMLGLSRQSLYVKLRKYDLLAKDDG